MEPSAAGLLAEFTVPSWFMMAPWPLPEEFAVNTLGTMPATGSATEFDRFP